MDEKIWIVYGAQGEYSDASEWTVCACWTKKEAQNIVNKLTIAHKLYEQAYHSISCDTSNRWEQMGVLIQEYKKLDPYYGGMDNCVYNCYEVEIKSDI